MPGNEPRLILGDCLEVLPTLPANSVDAVITDPPYLLEFMGKDFDSQHKDLKGDNDGQRMQEWHKRWAKAVLRVLKPGGYLLAFGGSRTSHRLTCALEDAGFYVNDMLLHLFGSGFPKGKSCLKPSYEAIILCSKPGPRSLPLGIDECRVETKGATQRPPLSTNKHDGYCRPWNENEEAREACEKRRQEAHDKRDIISRWPANLILQHPPECKKVGVKKVKGATAVEENRDGKVHNKIYGKFNKPARDNQGYTDQDGLETIDAWECADDCPVKAFERFGESKPKAGRTGKRGGKEGMFGQKGIGSPEQETTWPEDVGGTPARFFNQFQATEDDLRFMYCSKASRREREEGLEGLAKKACGSMEDDAYEWPDGRNVQRANIHPTVKPLAVVSWLIKLACPEGGLVLDPFMGSGTTGKACKNVGRNFLGIEMNPEYFLIAEKRVGVESSLVAGQQLNLFYLG